MQSQIAEKNKYKPIKWENKHVCQKLRSFIVSTNKCCFQSAGLRSSFAKLIEICAASRLRKSARIHAQSRWIWAPGFFSCSLLTFVYSRKWKSFLDLLRALRSCSNRESRSPLAGSRSIEHKYVPSRAHISAARLVSFRVLYTRVYYSSACGTSQIIPEEKTRTKIEMRRSCKRERTR